MGRLTKHGALLVVGSGPRIGIHVAAKFSRGGFDRIVLMARNGDRLRDDAFIIMSIVPDARVDAITVDLADEESLSDSLDHVDELLGDTPIEVVHFNAARTLESELLSWPSADLRLDLEISVVSLYTLAQWAMPRLSQIAGTKQYTPTLLVTNGWLEREPEPKLFSLGVCKAAQENIIAGLTREYNPIGVHCATVPVEHGDFDPTSVAESSWGLYNTGTDHKLS